MAERVEQTSQLISRSLHFSLAPVEKPAQNISVPLKQKKGHCFFSSESVVISALNRRVITSALIEGSFLLSYQLFAVLSKESNEVKILDNPLTLT
jgi:hypothetical protein